MKVNNAAIFMGDSSRSQRHNGIQEEKGGRKSIFAGNMKDNFDPIARKKQQARQQEQKLRIHTFTQNRKQRARQEVVRGSVSPNTCHLLTYFLQV